MTKTATRTAARSSNLVASIAAPKLVPAKADSTKAPAPHVIKGKLAVVRNAAMAGVASLAFVEGNARADVIAQLKIALGAKPAQADVDALAQEYIIGRVAARLADNAKTVADQISAARDIVTRYAAPPKDGVAARALRAGQLGRRTVEQHKAVRAAEQAWSQLKADVVPEMSNAKTQSQVVAEREAKKRAARVTTSNSAKAPTAGAGVGQGVTHTELVKSDGPMTADAACAYIMNMAATLNMFAAKHAGVVPAEYGMSIKRFHGAINELAKAREAVRNVEA